MGEGGIMLLSMVGAGIGVCVVKEGGEGDVELSS